MSQLPGRLGLLTAQHVMSGQIIPISESDTLEQAAQTLRRHHITGAPVVDEAGKLVGIISAWDLIRPEQPSEASARPPVQLTPGEGPSVWELFEEASPVGSGRDGLVRDRMSRRVVSVGLDASLVAVARAMCSGHWHRVPVIDSGGKLAGIVSTLDVLAALVNAADEPG